MIQPDIVEKVIQRLAAAYNPETIFIFGSYAWGNPEQANDIDILVVVENSEEKPYKRITKGLRSLRGLKIPKDILVYTREEFEELAEDVSSLPFKVRNEGVKVYEAA